jgi:glutaredoxin-like protein NrdH
MMSSHEVKLYSLSTCSHCKSTKKLLGEIQIAFSQVDVDLCDGEERERVIAEIKSLNPALSFPTLVIDGRVIVGYKEQEIKAALA